jgi:hypothetical protein
MHDDDVSPSDMTHHEFTDDDAEALLSGATSGDPRLGDALDDIRSAFQAIDPPIVTGALTEFVGADSVGSDPTDTTGPAVVSLNVNHESPRRHPMLTSVSAFAGTALGKIAIGASVAAASVGGAAATGIIDTPFEENSVVETEFVEDESIESDDSVDESVDDSAADSLDDDAIEIESGLDDDDADDDSSDDGDDSDDSDESPDEDDSDDSDESSDEDDSDDGDDSTTTTTIPNPGGVASVSHTVDGVGTVAFTYDNGIWTLTNVSPAAGWTVSESSVDAEGPDVTFEMGELEVDVDVEIENGQIRVRVRTENDSTDEETEVFSYYAIN